MSFEVYKVLHVAGALVLLFALGAMTLAALGRGAAPAAGGDGEDAPGGEAGRDPHKGLLHGFHGAALLVLVVTGFGALAKLGVGAPPAWAWAKLGVWLALGAAPAVLKRAPHGARAMWFVLPLVAAAAAALAILKPGA